jgi:hypothetical protein
MILKFFRQIFGKSSNTKFNKNPPTGNGVFPYGQAVRRTDQKNLTVALRNYVNAPKNLPVGGADSSGIRHAALAEYYEHGNELGVPKRLQTVISSCEATGLSRKSLVRAV